MSDHRTPVDLYYANGDKDIATLLSDYEVVYCEPICGIVEQTLPVWLLTKALYDIKKYCEIRAFGKDGAIHAVNRGDKWRYFQYWEGNDAKQTRTTFCPMVKASNVPILTRTDWDRFGLEAPTILDEKIIIRQYWQGASLVAWRVVL
jgi:hypothetical protein